MKPINSIKLSKIDDEWDKVHYSDKKPDKVVRKRINAKAPTPPKRTGGNKPGKRLNYKFPDPDGE